MNPTFSHTTYWQHPDHLGSASWVTDTNGLGYQHLQYMPWGEQWIDQRKTGYSYNTRYTFSGKERDEETGFSYFGARYYQPSLSIWLSVDPMADKYPGLSPYAYCANNPVILKDPNGKTIWVIGEDGSKYKYIQGQLLDKNGNQYDFQENSFEGNAVRALNTLKNTTTGNKLVSTFELSTEFNVTIEHSTKTHCTNEIVSAESGKIIGGTIEWNERVLKD